VPVIAFKCRLLSPFHTAGERYSNVQTCAPYVLGSTLRGAMLSHIVRRLCPAEQFELLLCDNPGYHAECPGPCGAKPLFDVSKTRFSFGRFPDDRPPRAFRSRVAIDRERCSVAEGALLQFEVIPPVSDGRADTTFTFEVETTDESLSELVISAARWAGEAGVGAFRNEGYGRFTVEDARAGFAPAPQRALPAGTHRLEVETPYVLPGLPFGEAAIKRDLDRLLGDAWSADHLEEARVEEANLGYIGRWCYEDDLRHTRAVALPGSALTIHVRCDLVADQVARIQRGLGEWAEVGFGRFKIAVGVGPD